MKLNISGCRAYCAKNGITNYAELSDHLDIPLPALGVLERGNEIGYEVVKDIYNKHGEKAVRQIIDFGEETMDGFKSKYVLVGERLY